jgi:hypothetical protein
MKRGRGFPRPSNGVGKLARATADRAPERQYESSHSGRTPPMRGLPDSRLDNFVTR